MGFSAKQIRDPRRSLNSHDRRSPQFLSSQTNFRSAAVDEVFRALSAYMAMILEDTAQNVRGRLDLRDVGAILSDLASSLTGAVQHAADAMAGRLA